MKTKTILLTTLLLIGATAAYEDIDNPNETQIEQTNLETGWFTPDSPLYGIETLIDNARINLGLATPAEITEKRTNEIYHMQGKQNWNGVNTAIQALSEPAERSQTEQDNESLQKAETKIEEVLQQTHQAENEELQRNIVENSKQLNNSHPELQPQYIIEDLRPNAEQIITDEDGIPMIDRARTINQLNHIENELYPHAHENMQQEEDLESFRNRVENFDHSEEDWEFTGENGTIGGGEGFIYGDVRQDEILEDRDSSSEGLTEEEQEQLREAYE